MDNLNVKKRYIQLHPQNATSGGVFSHKNGLPLIKFNIAASQVPLLLDGGALRLTGNFTSRQGAAGTTKLTETQLNFLDGFCGINNCIEMITISSLKLNSVLERITNYYRLIPSIVSGQHSMKDIETKMGIQANQHSTIPTTKNALASYNFFNSNGAITSQGNQKGLSFSSPLYCGIFQSGQDIDLSMTGGLVIEILLRSDVGVIFGTNAAANNATYNLSNLVLTAPVYESMGTEPMGAGVREFNFNSWSSMFQTINSSNSVVAMTPGLSRVASCLVNFVTASDLGNQLFNACRLGPVGEIKQLRWSKNGAMYPLQYRLQTVSEQNNLVAQIDATNSYHIYGVKADILRNYLEGLTTDRYNKVKNSLFAYNSWEGGAVDRPQNAGRDGITPSTCDGIAILYDAYGSGTDFSQSVWSFELNASSYNQLQLSGVLSLTNSIDGTATTAQAATIFFLNKNTVVMSPTGINIQR